MLILFSLCIFIYYMLISYIIRKIEHMLNKYIKISISMILLIIASLMDKYHIFYSSKNYITNFIGASIAISICIIWKSDFEEYIKNKMRI